MQTAKSCALNVDTNMDDKRTTEEIESNEMNLIDYLKANGFSSVMMKTSIDDPHKALLVYETDGGFETVIVRAGMSTTQFEDPQDLVNWIEGQKEDGKVIIE